MVNEGDTLPEREKTAFEPKAVVANSGKPRKVNTWARQFMGWCLRAPLEAKAAAAAIAGVKRTMPTKEERQQYADHVSSRARYGKSWWKRSRHGHSWWNWTGHDPNHNGDREIARRRSQIERGLLSPIYRSTPEQLERAA